MDVLLNVWIALLLFILSIIQILYIDPQPIEYLIESLGKMNNTKLIIPL